jgi:hypothetical protein
VREVDYTRVTKDYKDYNYITRRLDTNITTKYKGTIRTSKSYTKYNTIDTIDTKIQILTELLVCAGN